METETKAELEFVSARRGSQVLGIHWTWFTQVADAAGIRRRTLPGMQQTRYNMSDIERVARESVIDPTAEQTQGPGPVGIVAAGREEKKDGPRPIRQESARSAPTQRPTKKAGVHTR